MGESSTETGPGAARIDRWLFAVRLFKSRSLAADAVSGGKVHINHERVKPSHSVQIGDTVTFTRGTVVFECVVSAIPLRRGPAAQAARRSGSTSLRFQTPPASRSQSLAL